MRGLRAFEPRPHQLGRAQLLRVQGTLRGRLRATLPGTPRAGRPARGVGMGRPVRGSNPPGARQARPTEGARGEWLPQELKARLENVGKAIAHTERQRERLLEAYLGGVLELAEFERKRKELESRADALLAQERQLEASARERTELAAIADSIEEFCERVRAGLADATFEQKRRLVELLIDRVIVNDEEVEIRYVVPTSPEGPHQPFCHLRTDYLERVMNSIRNGLGMRETEIAREPSRP